MGIRWNGHLWIVMTPLGLGCTFDREAAVRAYLAAWEMLLGIERFNKEHQTEVA